jgi:hypothetical protein
MQSVPPSHFARVVVVERAEEAPSHKGNCPMAVQGSSRSDHPHLNSACIQYKRIRARGGARNASACSLDGHLALFVRAEGPATIILLQGNGGVGCLRFRVSARLTFDSKEGQTWQQDALPSLSLFLSLRVSLLPGVFKQASGLSINIFRHALPLLPVNTRLPREYMDAASAVALVM